MSRSSFGFRLAPASAYLALSMGVATISGFQAQQRTPSKEESLKAFLQEYVRAAGPGDYKRTRYSAAFVSLEAGGTEDALVYLTGDGWCGSGGCTTLVLAPDRASWRIVTKITITWPPIRALKGMSNGWRDLAVWVRGGGIRPGYEAVLRFNGESYPENPSVVQWQSPTGGGEVVISQSDHGSPLFP